MTRARVTAEFLNLRASPGGSKLGTLARSSVVQLLADDGSGWAEVVANGTRGFVARRYLELLADAAAPVLAPAPPVAVADVPPDLQPADLRFNGNKLLDPRGVVVGKRYELGLFNYGTTSIGDFLGGQAVLFSNVSQSLVRVMQAVSANEGKLEAINTWDNAFMTFGIMQWTAGTGSAGGEIVDLLWRLKADYAAAYEDCFGRYGIELEIAPQRDRINTGYLKLNGKRLDTSVAKAVLREPIWAYRFWRAGHVTAVRECQIRHAMARIATFYRAPRSALGNRRIADLVGSEYGVAQLLDQHVNRPGHVPATLIQAYNAGVAERLIPADPAQWTSAEERQLIAGYLELRKGTSMTDGEQRAKNVREALEAKQLSDERGSFQVA